MDPPLLVCTCSTRVRLTPVGGEFQSCSVPRSPVASVIVRTICKHTDVQRPRNDSRVFDAADDNKVASFLSLQVTRLYDWCFVSGSQRTDSAKQRTSWKLVMILSFVAERTTWGYISQLFVGLVAGITERYHPPTRDDWPCIS